MLKVPLVNQSTNQYIYNAP